MTYELFSWDRSVSSEWDEFVLESPCGSVHQVSAWKQLQEHIPGREKVLGFGARETASGAIRAVTFCVMMDTGFLGKYWYYSARGPVFDPEKDAPAGKFLIEQVAQTLQQEEALFWRLDPYLPPHSTFRVPGSKVALQNYQPTDTLVIDLTQSEDEILAGMKRKGRYNINLARKKGVEIEVIEKGAFTPQDLEDFWQLHLQTTGRDGFSGHEKSYYEHFLQELRDSAGLFFAVFEAKRIAGAISTFCGDKAIYYFGVSTSDPAYRNLMAPYLLQWEMMKYAKTKGCESYDFLGIAPEGVEHHPYSGISEFKWKFGGQRQRYAAGREIIFRPWWYRLYRCGKFLKR